MSDTIAAISTPPGIGGIALLRVSGTEALKIADLIFKGTTRPSESQPRLAILGHAMDPETGEEIDRVVLTPGRAPNTYTGEDLVEISCHGGKRVPRMVLEALIKAGARLAEPGEFTRRAFLSGKLDLIQARAVLEIIEAETEGAVRLARDRLKGGASKRFEGLKEGLLELLSKIEANVDFPEDVPEPKRKDVLHDIDDTIGRIESLLEEGRRGRAHLKGVRVVISGRTNVGKSTLFNAILGADRVIVTAEPGTTRDVVSEGIVLNGVPVTLSDTAGVRDPRGLAEEMGVNRARSALKGADLVLFVVDASEPLEPDDLDLWNKAPPSRILVLNKIDLGENIDISSLSPDANDIQHVSALKGQGIDELRTSLGNRLVDLFGSSGEFSVSLREEGLLLSAREDMNEGRTALENGLPLDIVSLHVTETVNRLDEILGVGSVSDAVLERVFRDFCVGK
jgi:tRNA modification GTPase